MRLDAHRSLALSATVVLALGLAACGNKPAPTGESAAPANAGPPPVPTLEQLADATVTGVFDQAVTLADWRWEGEPFEPGTASRPTLLLWKPSVVFGDLDGVPGNEAVVLMGKATGGSGEFVHVGVFGIRDSKAVSLGTAEVGDRNKLQSVWVEKGRIVMDVVQAGPADAACCGTQIARKIYAFEGGVLKQVSAEPIGTLAVSTLGANEWQLVEIDGRPVPEGLKPPLIHFEKDSVRGFGGCNRISGPVKETAPGSIKVGPVIATRMACPQPAMDLETQFLDALNKVSGYTYLAGQLSLTWMQDGAARTMLLSK